MAVKIGHASGSENGTIKGNAGDQTGREVFTRNWYKHSKGWVALRCTVPGMAEYIAQAMEKACANNDIGYDQSQNGTLWNNIKDKGFDPSKTTKKVETDCARLVRVCVQYAAVKMGLNVTIPDFYTATLANVLVRTGFFEKLTASKYTTQDDYLERGMILVTKTKGHTLVILTNGSKAKTPVLPDKTYILGERYLENGCEGSDVKELQSMLIQLDYDLGKWGADGDFGDATEAAVRKFQSDNKLEVDGIVGKLTLAALLSELKDDEPTTSEFVFIVNGNCYVRTQPNTSGKILGTAREHEKYKYLGETSDNGWRKISHPKGEGYVSGKYSKMAG